LLAWFIFVSKKQVDNFKFSFRTDEITVSLTTENMFQEKVTGTAKKTF